MRKGVNNFIKIDYIKWAFQMRKGVIYFKFIKIVHGRIRTCDLSINSRSL